MENLPDEMLFEIIKHLDAKTMLNQARTNLDFSILVNDPRVWRLLYRRDFPGDYRMFTSNDGLFCILGLDWKLNYLWTSFYTRALTDIIVSAVKERKLSMPWVATIEPGDVLDTAYIFQQSQSFMLYSRLAMIKNKWQLFNDANISMENFGSMLLAIGLQNSTTILNYQPDDKGFGLLEQSNLGIRIKAALIKHPDFKAHLHAEDTAMFRAILNFIIYQDAYSVVGMQQMLTDKLGMVTLTTIVSTFIDDIDANGNFLIRYAGISNATKLQLKRLYTFFTMFATSTSGRIFESMVAQKISMAQLEKRLSHTTMITWAYQQFFIFSGNGPEFVTRYTIEGIEEYGDEFPEILDNMLLSLQEIDMSDGALSNFVMDSVYDGMRENIKITTPYEMQEEEMDSIPIYLRLIGLLYYRWYPSDYPRTRKDDKLFITNQI